MAREVIIHGDSLDVISDMEDNSVDSVVTDPPYGLSKEPDISEVLSKWLAGEEIEVGEKVTTDGRNKPIDNAFNRGMTTRKNSHPTVKPVDLMAWLVRLITPEGGTVLDPFAGSGSTLVAAKREGFGFIGVELTGEYIPIIEARTGVKATNIDEGGDA